MMVEIGLPFAVAIALYANNPAKKRSNNPTITTSAFDTTLIPLKVGAGVGVGINIDGPGAGP
jgi:hypothetical protein